ncbi:hypothetical protein [Ekhidna sp.]|uniref:hypothetical protein n=1 Tax=Ekhidna sp. TaxID=2608089 RepID=UPI00351257B3
MILIRFGQSYFIGQESYYGLKWLLLGEWLNQGFKMYSQTFDYTGPIAVFFYKYLNLIFGRSEFIHYGVSSLVIIFQAGIFNHLLLKNKAYDENGYLPAFLYIILMVSVPDFMTLSPQLLSLTFVLLALRNVLRRIDNQVTDELFLNSGIFIGVATMIYLPAVVFFLVFLFSLILFSSAVARRLLLYLFSFLLVFTLCALYFYWRGDFWIFVESYVSQNLLLAVEAPLSGLEVLALVSPFVLILVLSVFKTWTSGRPTNFQQKIQQVIWLMLFGAVATFFLSNEKSMHELVFGVPPIAYFWTHYFMLLKRKIFRFIMPGLLIFGLVAYSCFSYLNLAKPMQVEKEGVENSSTMILGSNLAYYVDRKILTPCFNEHLSQRAFEGLDYYITAGELYKLIERANPELILDEMKIMPEIRERFPELANKYRHQGGNSYRKISN